MARFRAGVFFFDYKPMTASCARSSIRTWRLGLAKIDIRDEFTDVDFWTTKGTRPSWTEPASRTVDGDGGFKALGTRLGARRA